MCGYECVTDHKAGSSVCEASSRMSFCEGERGPSWPIAWCYPTTVAGCVTVAGCSHD